MVQKSLQINDVTQGQIDDLVRWGHGPHFSAVVRTAIDRMWNAEREREMKMKTYTIEQKMSGTGTIHDIASQHYDRIIEFRGNTRFAVVEAAYYTERGGGRGYTTHETEESALRQSMKLSKDNMSHTIIDAEGRIYMPYNNGLRCER